MELLTLELDDDTINLATHIYNAWSELFRADAVSENDFLELPHSKALVFSATYATQLLLHTDLHHARHLIARQCKEWPDVSQIPFEQVLTDLKRG